MHGILSETVCLEETFPTSEGTGGLCGSHAVGAYHILKSIGYDCYPIVGDVPSMGMCHGIIIVKDLEHSGDLHLVDVGASHPTLGSIPLQLSGKLVDRSDIKTHSFLTYKFVRDGRIFRRLHLKSRIEPRTGSNVIENHQDRDQVWVEFYSFKLDPVSVEELRGCLNRNSYLCPKSKFNRLLLLCKYPSGKYVGVKGFKEGRECEDDNCLKFTQFEDNESFKHFCKENYPEIPENVATRALNCWRNLPESLRM